MKPVLFTMYISPVFPKPIMFPVILKTYFLASKSTTITPANLPFTEIGVETDTTVSSVILEIWISEIYDFSFPFKNILLLLISISLSL